MVPVDATGDGLEVYRIFKSFDSVPVLVDVSVAMRSGRVTALLGANGAGKSTLVKIISGSQAPDAGEVRLGGRALTAYNPRARLRDGIRTIQQEVALVDTMTVAENLVLGHESLAGPSVGLKPSQIIRAARSMVQSAGINLGVDLGTRASGLTAAQKQLVEMVKAVSVKAQVILMDEPSSTLSAREVEILRSVITRLRETGWVVVLVSHRMDEVMSLADDIVVLRGGRVSLHQEAARVTIPEIVEAMTGSTLVTHAEWTGEPPPEDARPARLVLENLRPAPGLQQVSLKLHEGEVVGITGAVGSGLQELGRVLAGSEPPCEGQIRVNGRVVHFRSPRDAQAAGISYLPDDRRARGLVLRQTIGFNGALESLRQFSRLGVVNLRRERSVVQQAVRSVGLVYRDLQQPASSLSGGNQQKLLLARLFLPQRPILVLSEPTAGVDVAARQEIYAIIRRQVSAGASALILSSDIQDITSMAGRAYVLARAGVAAVPPGWIRDEPAIARMVLGGDSR